MDWSSLFGGLGGRGQAPSPDGGWSSGTTITPSNSLTSQNLQGGFAGLSQAGKGLMQGIGRGMMGAANQMPGSQGAFSNNAADLTNDPNHQAFMNFLQSWKQSRMQRPMGGTGNTGGGY